MTSHITSARRRFQETIQDLLGLEEYRILGFLPILRFILGRWLAAF